MAKLNPYLTFNGSCKEAMNFYKEIFGGKLDIMLAGDSPAKDQMPSQYHNQVLHSYLDSGKIQIMATDMMPEKFNEGNTVTLALTCESDEETRSLFAKLSAGGKVTQPLHEAFFGLFGALTDRFGKYWLFQFSNAPMS